MQYTIEFQYNNNAAVIRFEGGTHKVVSLEGLTKEILNAAVKAGNAEIIAQAEAEAKERAEVEKRVNEVKALAADLEGKNFSIDAQGKITEKLKTAPIEDTPII